MSDTTLWRDRNTKMRMYSAAGIADYWVLDVNNRKLYVHRTPPPTGYTNITEYDETQTVTPLAALNATPSVADLLP